MVLVCHRLVIISTASSYDRCLYNIHHHKDHILISLNLIDNLYEENYGGFVWLIIQPMSHLPNFLLSQPLNRLLVPKYGGDLQFKEGGGGVPRVTPSNSLIMVPGGFIIQSTTAPLTA